MVALPAGSWAAPAAAGGRVDSPVAGSGCIPPVVVAVQDKVAAGWDMAEAVASFVVGSWAGFAGDNFPGEDKAAGGHMAVAGKDCSGKDEGRILHVLLLATCLVCLTIPKPRQHRSGLPVMSTISQFPKRL